MIFLKGFGSANWHATIDDDSLSVTFSLLSPDGDQGYPGNLNAFARYSLSPVSGDLKVEYWGIPDKKTPINLSNHVYLNLAGHNKGLYLILVLIIVVGTIQKVVSNFAELMTIKKSLVFLS